MSGPETPADVDPDLLPILGEPIPVEFANTLYRRPGAEVDFLGSAEWVVAWFDHADTATLGAMPRHLDAAQLRSIQSLRDAVHSLLTAVTGGETPPAAAIATLNKTAALMPCRVRLAWDTSERPTATTTPVGRGVNAIVAAMAIECISFIASPMLELVRRCDGPDCPMFFVQRHHKRRFCHDGCAHRARQSRYYRSHHQPARSIRTEQR